MKFLKKFLQHKELSKIDPIVNLPGPRVKFNSESIVELSNNLQDIFLELRDDGFNVDLSANKITDKCSRIGQDYFFLVNISKGVDFEFGRISEYIIRSIDYLNEVNFDGVGGSIDVKFKDDQSSLEFKYLDNEFKIARSYFHNNFYLSLLRKYPEMFDEVVRRYGYDPPDLNSDTLINSVRILYTLYYHE